MRGGGGGEMNKKREFEEVNPKQKETKEGR